tara:strand:+ start:2708 stop:3415 length:708 start_codon:yes stop_codon:yes gene_type:complete
MKYKTLTLIGTSHIAAQSVKEIQTSVQKHTPDIIAIELDKRRFKAITSKKKQKLSIAAITEIGFKGYLFAQLGKYVQQKLGSKVGLHPGSDMLEGIIQAKKHKLKLALIDQDITITLKRFSKAFNYKEKWHLVEDFFKALFRGKKQLQKLGITNFDLTKVPSKKIINKLLNQVKLRYPRTYKVLVEDRNHFMAKNLIKLMNKHPKKKILAIVGAGHEDRILELVKKIDQHKVEYI